MTPEGKKPDISPALCGYSKALEILSDKWTALAIHAMDGESIRYGVMKSRISGISQKMLTQTLRRLERDGLVRREVFATVPPSTEYSLTPLGESLLPVLKRMKEWADAHYSSVERAREAL
ncbi:helix-turn-helix domain-containing protein [Paenibacillus aurantius]|uniref:Helix-turn-helix domain-containing protein n=1 Tax=Paenibacillus aurantius TaxID=2918900 RepID=A0AA96RGX3_9BACL|nr:helix-turn-helix domain-containing protein [Paenibacillus aurantius]WNQ10514.1 helix-turn-helix domain-containing protein [Paenibacillus aurantius]